MAALATVAVGLAALDWSSNEPRLVCRSFIVLDIARMQFFPTLVPLVTEPAFGTGKNQSCLNMMNQNPGERMGSDPIASEKVAIERKIFFLDLKENQRGRFLKITEDVGGRRDTIMLPAGAFRDFLEALQRLVEFESKL